MKKTLLILMTLFTVVIGSSQTFTENFITYQVISTTNNTVLTSDYNVAGGSDVVIPATVTNTSVTPNVTYSVTRIGSLSFTNNQLTSVIIPNTVTIIGNDAFKDNLLTSINLPNSITTINLQSFQSNLLTDLVIPDSVTSIGTTAFANNQLANITLPTSITSIATQTFSSNQLTSITIPNTVTSIGVLAFGTNQLTSVTIPASVTNIDNAVFYNNPLTCIISEATIPPTIETSSTAFNDSFGDRSVLDLSIPSGTASAYAAQWTGFNSVTEGLTGTFVVDHITYQIISNPNNEVRIIGYNTAGGTVVDIPASVSSDCTSFSVTHIGDFSFENKNITSLTLPNSIIEIGEAAFLINNLLTVTIPDSVTTINEGAFANNNLTDLVIGNSVTSIGEYAFRFNNLASLTIPDNVINIEAFAFNSNTLTNLQLGNGLQIIGNEAFSFNYGLQSVVIPASVTTIGDSAFSIPTLTDVTSLASIPPTLTTGTNDTFGSTSLRGNINLHIPPNTTDPYVNDTGALWTDFFSVTEDALLSTSEFEITNTIKIITTTEKLKVISSGTATLEHYAIYSITGAKIKEGTENTIAIEALSKGIYILELTFDTGKLTKKFVK